MWADIAGATAVTVILCMTIHEIGQTMRTNIRVGGERQRAQIKVETVDELLQALEKKVS